MKRLNTPLATLLLALGLTGSVQAQDCKAYFPMREGAMMELSSYNDKGKLETTTTTTVKALQGTGDHLTATAHAVVKDAKGRDISSTDYDVACDNGAFKMDMKAMASSGMPQGMENMEIHIESDDVVFPADMAVGSTLPDASYSMKASMNGMTLMNSTMKSTNRKVTARETITTPAGAFDCLLIESTDSGGAAGMNFTSQSKAWYSLGVGLVRHESVRNGKSDGYQVLTKIER